MSDWVAVMNAGKVVQWGPPWEIYYHPRTPFMADFVGTVNLVKGVVVSAESDAAHVRVANEEIVVPGDWSSLKPGGRLCSRSDRRACGWPRSTAGTSMRAQRSPARWCGTRSSAG